MSAGANCAGNALAMPVRPGSLAVAKAMLTPPLTSRQIKDFEIYFGEFDSVVLDHGDSLAETGAVVSAEWCLIDGDNAIKGIVKGRVDHQVIIGMDGTGEVLFTECGCSKGYDCVHAAALMRRLIREARQAAEDLPLNFVDMLKPSPQDALGSAVAAKHNGPLPRALVKFLERARPFWETRQRTLDQTRLMEMLGTPAHWRYGQVELWPEECPPRDEWEFLTCLDMAATALGAGLPKPLQDMLDPLVRRRLREERQRVADIHAWRRQLAQWQEGDIAEEAAQAPDLRLLLHARGATVQVRHPGDADFGKCTQKLLKEMRPGPYTTNQKAVPALNAGSGIVLAASGDYFSTRVNLDSHDLELARALGSLIRTPDLLLQHVAGEDGEPLEMMEDSLRWELKAPASAAGDYTLRLVTAEGTPLPPAISVTPGVPAYYVTPRHIYPVDHWPFQKSPPKLPLRIPAPALESREGVNMLACLGLEPPPRLAGRVKMVRAGVLVRARIHRYEHSASEYFQTTARASYAGGAAETRAWNGERWAVIQDAAPAKNSSELIQVDSRPLAATSAWLRQMPAKPVWHGQKVWLEQRIQGRDWPEQFLAWLERRPLDIEVQLDPELSALREGSIAGQVRLDIEESKSGMDWFDLQLSLEVNDHSLTPEETALLLKARGKWVRLPGKGWRKLDFQLTPEQERDLAEIGISPHQLDGNSQRLHTLQLGALARRGSAFLDEARARQLQIRLDEIETRVTPPLPAAITATLRPYQMQGYHFLAYLAANGFGGVLADDMGLGKTLQALAWIAWLRGEKGVTEPVLVVCPKSVQDNWRAEAARFCPGLQVEVWSRRAAGKAGLDGGADLLIIHFAQLRQHEENLCGVQWGAVILDEAQAIKNPASQSARAACALNARHRLALTGTPVENRLMDLWSIFAFAMPGVLGTRAGFTRNFDSKEDPLARRRLAARTRPFLLRRTKKEVATDLPERVEEDLVIELEGRQATLYQAELKRARAQLLKAQTGQALDKLRFNILTSLLRLRQICCHPRLVGLEKEDAAAPAEAPAKKRGRKKAAAIDGESAPADASESAKVAALMELLEPLMEEGQKVLVFSQFVEMLEILREEASRQGWKQFILTGQTEERGELVREFQETEGAGVFFISLKAGGFGLNLTAASYVVLFDPWWNPAVEAQAIDRTHRIGQKQTVFAYRLLVKDSIEEKIRVLQKQKGALAQDILGEENFAQALTLDDFEFLLGGE